MSASRISGVLATAGDAAESAYAYEPRADEPARISDTITPSGSVPQ